ncbi:MAG: hypothetical protein FJ257_04700 [Phycisphaerae bacterium]|nr:hypothetical protein [Phycisphaerae bacterium]
MRTTVALFSGALDYAGLFPPASLDMSSTVDRYAAALAGEDRWFMGRIIVPVNRLEEFERLAAPRLPVTKDALHAPVWLISVLVPPLWERSLGRALDEIAAFNDRHVDSLDGAALVDTIEAKAATSEEIDFALDMLPEEIFPYFELPVHRDVRGLVATMAGLDAGAKVRTGGVKPEEHPTPAQLADFIAACAGAEVPFKATAGLHHPLRHLNPAVPADQFGCVGLLLGASLAWSDAMPASELPAILEERDATAFRLDAEHASWRGHRVAHAEILKARERFAHSFGSCSIDEPLAHLRDLGWLPREASHA